MTLFAFIAGSIFGGAVVYAAMLLDAYEDELERRFKASVRQDEKEVIHEFGCVTTGPGTPGNESRDPLFESDCIDGEKSEGPGCSDPGPHLTLVTDRDL